MESAAGFGAKAEVSSSFGTGVRIANFWEIRCYSWRYGGLLWEECVKNITVTQGLNDILTKYFTGSSYTAAWYVGLVNNASFTAFAAGDTAAQIGGTNGWIEDTAYGAGVRQTLTLGSASSGSISNTASPASFTMNASGTLNGAFLASANSGTSGVLYAEASFGSTQPYSSGNVITVTCTLTMTRT